MKKIMKVSFAVVLMIMGAAIATTGCKQEDQATPADPAEKAATEIIAGTSGCGCILDSTGTVTAAEINMLKHMREEEKLARDVYTVLYAQYNIPIFNNISKSEQVHMDQVLCLMDFFNIPDPASPQAGIFSDTSLQNLYNILVQQGSVSLIDALTVGATVEDVDIYDLEESISNASNSDLIRVFKNLACASGNHMRAFSRQLDKKGGGYTPQFLTQQEYDDILNSTFADCKNN